MRGLFSSALLLSSLRVVTSAAKCYFPNGDVAAGNFPCDEDADDSPCCWGGLGAVCLSNKLCRNPEGNIARGACTNQTWDSGNCPNFCLHEETGGWDLISCSNVTDSSTSYCCEGTANCCNSGVGRFDASPQQDWATWNRESSRFVIILKTTSSASPTSTLATSTLAPTTTASTTPLPTSTTPTTPSPTATQSERQEDTAPSGLATGAKAGIGAGVGAGAILIVVILFLLFKIRKNKVALQALQAQQPETEQVHRWAGGRDTPQPRERPVSNGVKYELDARPMPAEGQWERVELPTPIKE